MRGWTDRKKFEVGKITFKNWLSSRLRRGCCHCYRHCHRRRLDRQYNQSTCPDLTTTVPRRSRRSKLQHGLYIQKFVLQTSSLLLCHRRRHHRANRLCQAITMSQRSELRWACTRISLYAVGSTSHIVSDNDYHRRSYHGSLIRNLPSLS